MINDNEGVITDKRKRVAVFSLLSPTLVPTVEFALDKSGPRTEWVFQSQIHLKSQIQDLSSLFEEEGEEEDEKSFFRFRQ